MTLSALLADCYRRLGFAASPASEVTTRLTGFLNETQQALATEPSLSSLTRGVIGLVSVAAQSDYTLPSVVSRILSVRDRTNMWKLVAQTRDWYRTYVPDPTRFNATPYAYVPLGPQAVKTQPTGTSVSGLRVVSTAAGDTTQTIYVEGIDSLGNLVQTSGALNGIVPVTFGNLLSIVTVTDVYLSAVAAGTVTLTEVTFLTTLLVLSPNQLRNRYNAVALVGTPTAVLTYDVEYEREVTDLVNATDEPAWLPPRGHRLLAIGARIKEYEKTDDSRIAQAQAEYTKELHALIYYVTCPPDKTYIPGGRPDRSSNLGPWFPAGRW